MSTRRSFIIQTASAGLLAAATVPAREQSPLGGDAARLSTYRLPNTDLEVSRIAFGFAFLIDWNRDPLSPEEIVRASRVTHRAYDCGITFFDLADIYGCYKAELALGEVLKETPGLRHKVVIQSKCGVGFPDDWRGSEAPSFYDCSYQHIVKSVEGSLTRLGTDYLDILLLHYADVLVEPQEVAQAFDELHRAGKVRYFGVSNHGAAQIELLRRDVKQPLVADQVHIGLGHPDLIEEGLSLSLDARVTGVVDYCRRHNIGIQAHSPFRGDVMSPPVNATSGVRRAAQAIADFAAARGTTRWVVALSWLLCHPAKIIPIFGTRDPAHITENCLADALELGREEWYRLFLSAVTGHSATPD